MKKTIIWLVGIIMGLCCVALLLVQLSFFDTVVEMREHHFEEGVRRSLYQVSYQLEQEEMNRMIEHELQDNIVQAELIVKHIGAVDDEVLYLHEAPDVHSGIGTSLSMRRGHEEFRPTHYVKSDSIKPNKMAQRDKSSVIGANMLTRDMIKSLYVYRHDMLDRAIYELIFETSAPVEERFDMSTLEERVRKQLLYNGIDIPFSLVLVSNENDTLLKCGGSPIEEPTTFKEPLFRNDLTNKPAYISVSFPTSSLNKHIHGSVKFLLPMLLFSFVMLITFAVTLYMAIRHKRITKMRNDFINNMTHEFKTPISTISLAAQMLQDASVAKSPETIARLTGVVSNETKRLRFQVDKVLQISMFDEKNNAALKMKELDGNELISSIVSTFAVKAEQGGGHISSMLEATDPYIYVDEMHFTNVVFNLMDNAIKYKRPDVPIELEVRTWNSGGKFCLSVKDNGIGIPKEHIKRIFDRFYRVTEGNVHDVKGFGLGLAYVKQVVRSHGGTIKAESESGQGTEFVIVLPLK